VKNFSSGEFPATSPVVADADFFEKIKKIENLSWRCFVIISENRFMMLG